MAGVGGAAARGTVLDERREKSTSVKKNSVVCGTGEMDRQWVSDEVISSHLGEGRNGAARYGIWQSSN